jgi:hypothetical protein
LQKVYQSLKPNGQILFTIPGKPLPEITSILSDLMNRDEWKKNFSNYVHPRKNLQLKNMPLYSTRSVLNPWISQWKDASIFLRIKEL